MSLDSFLPIALVLSHFAIVLYWFAIISYCLVKIGGLINGTQKCEWESVGTVRSVYEPDNVSEVSVCKSCGDSKIEAQHE